MASGSEVRLTAFAEASALRKADATGVLGVATRADVPDLFLAALIRAIATAIAPPNDFQHAEVLPIPDRQLRAWTRTPGPVAPPRADTVDKDDRRWLWGGVLLLLAVESWMRQRRRDAQPAIDVEPARVA